MVEGFMKHHWLVKSRTTPHDLKNILPDSNIPSYTFDKLHFVWLQDYEHCKSLFTKFADLNNLVETTGPARYDKAESLAKEIVEGNPNMKPEVDQRRSELTDKWNGLLEQLTDREAALKAALEIHAFNRDVDDAVTRIQEKETAMSTDLGKDVYTVQMLQRKHEGYENELVALEAQLQIVVDDAENLKAAYPGENAKHIGEQQVWARVLARMFACMCVHDCVILCWFARLSLSIIAI